MDQLVFSCSLSPTSRSAILARQLADEITRLGDKARLIDLRTFNLPMCDAGDCYQHPNVIELQRAIQSASAIAIATPIHNYETGGSTRNLVALGGSAWENKVLGFVCAAGGQGSYMAVTGLINSMMLDFRCFVVPRFVYATKPCFTDDRLSDAEVEKRIVELARELHRVAAALS